MWLVMCHSTDASAVWAYENLKKRGLDPVELITAEVLSFSLRWEYLLNDDGASINIDLADGRQIQSDAVRGVINRIMSLPAEHLQLASPDDAQYAYQELYAFFTGWLYSLPQPLLNPPTPRGLSGRWRHDSEWIWLAAKAGLRTALYRQSPEDYLFQQTPEYLMKQGPYDTLSKTIFVVEGRVVGKDVPEDVQSSCQRLSELAETPLMGVDFVDGKEGPWTFHGASCLPDFRSGGDQLLDALERALTRNNGGVQ